MIDVTYSQLLTLINSSGLTEDAEYRITDYEAPTLNSPFSYVSTPTTWNIKITAKSTSDFYDWVELEDSDDVTRTNIVAKYDFAGNKHTYNWINTSSKGVIYYLCDENGNEANFDFENICVNATNYESESLNDVSFITNSENVRLPCIYAEETDTYHIPNIHIKDSTNIDFDNIETSAECTAYMAANSGYTKSSYVEGENIKIGMPIYGGIYIKDVTSATIASSTVISNEDWISTTGTGITICIKGADSVNLGRDNNNIKILDSNIVTIGADNDYILVSGSTDISVGDRNYYADIKSESFQLGDDNNTITIAENTSYNTIDSNNNDITIASGSSCNVLTNNNISINLEENSHSLAINDSADVTVTANTQSIQLINISDVDITNHVAAGTIVTKAENGCNNLYNTSNQSNLIMDEDGNVTQDKNSPLYDAPQDGNQYARKDGGWTIVSGGTSEASANFRGTFNTWSVVPTADTGYAEDYYEHTTPLVNDYMVVKDASDYVPSTAPTFLIETASRVCTITYTKDGTTTIYNNVSSGNFGSDNELNVYKYQGDWYFKANTTLIYNNTTYSAGDVMFYITLSSTASKTITVVTDALSGSWRFNYQGVWATDGKTGWTKQYQYEGTGSTIYTAGQNVTITGTSNAINAVGYTYNSTTDSFAEATGNTASGQHSHSEGYNTTASGLSSHAEGYGSIASGNYSHSEGGGTIAIGGYSHAEGISTTANSSASHAEGTSTIANASNQHAQGRYNVADTTSAFIIGNGTADDARSNAMTVGWDGTLTIGGVSITPTQLQQLLNLLS